MNRRGIPILPLVALAAAVAYLVAAVRHLMASGVAFRQQVVAATRPVGGNDVLAEQTHWGAHTMFAVAAVALCLVVTLVSWVVGGRAAPGGPR